MASTRAQDGGTSGETFLATVDYLFAAEHDLLLLENVITAPWAKMAGFITGRARLVDVFSSTNCSAALAAGIFHRGEVDISEVKADMRENAIPTRT